jgi:hypothetical protein
LIEAHGDGTPVGAAGATSVVDLDLGRA